MIRLRPSGADEVLIKRVRDWYEPGPGVFIAPQALFNPALLFTTGVNGAWYDPSDLTTLFQDAAGTTPVTAVEQPVGLMLDKSGKSPTTWLQKIDDPTLSTTAGWSNPSVFSNGKYISGNSSYSLTATIGKLYRYTYTVSTASAGGLALYVCGVQKGTSSQIPAGTYSGTVVATSTKVFEFYDPGWGWTGQIDYVSVEELQGNHAFNASGNSANFPVLQQDGTGLYYLAFNGTNQWLQTNSIDFTSTVQMFVCAGVRKLSDYTTQSNAMVMLELGPQVDLNNGSLALVGSIGYNTGIKYDFDSKGTTTFVSANTTSASYAAPITSIVSGVSDLGGSPNDYAKLRINGSQISENITTQGDGPFGAYPLYIGARAGTSFWSNIRFYGAVIAGKQASASEITSTETFINQKTGAY